LRTPEGRASGGLFAGGARRLQVQLKLVPRLPGRPEERSGCGRLLRRVHEVCDLTPAGEGRRRRRAVSTTSNKPRPSTGGACAGGPVGEACSEGRERGLAAWAWGRGGAVRRGVEGRGGGGDGSVRGGWGGGGGGGGGGWWGGGGGRGVEGGGGVGGGGKGLVSGVRGGRRSTRGATLQDAHARTLTTDQTTRSTGKVDQTAIMSSSSSSHAGQQGQEDHQKVRDRCQKTGLSALGDRDKVLSNANGGRRGAATCVGAPRWRHRA